MRGTYSIIISVILITGIGLVPSSYTCAQDSETQWGIELSGGFPYGYFNVATRMTPVYGLSLDYDVSPAYTVQLMGYKGEFKVAERSNYFGRWYHNNFFQVSVHQQINFLRLFELNSIARYVDINGFAGLGFINSNVKTRINTSLPGYQKWEGVNNRGNSIAYSFGGGLTFKLTRNISFLMRYEYNLTNSDYLDGFKTVPSNNDTRLPPRSGNDSYTYTTAGFSLRFGGKKKNTKPHPVVENVNKEPQPESMKQLEQLGLLVKSNSQNLQETNDQIRKTLQLLTDFVKTASESQIKQQSEYSRKLQIQIDSLRKRQLKTDSLIVLKQRVDSLIQQRQKSLSRERKQKRVIPVKAKYYVVADSYLDYSDATTFLTKLKSEGYSNATIISDDSNTYYLVAYTVMDNEKAANLMLKKIKSYQNPMAWLYRGR